MAETRSNLYKIIIMIIIITIIIIIILTEKRTHNTAFVPQTVYLRSTVKKKTLCLPRKTVIMSPTAEDVKTVPIINTSVVDPVLNELTLTL